MDLFEHALGQDLSSRPLADAVRPGSIDDFFGQEHVVGPGSFFRRTLEADRLVSMIFWGPPGVGKTTLAYLVAGMTQRRFIAFSAVLGGVKELRHHLNDAQKNRNYHGQQTILFIDEIHRFNRAQQDALLPYVENGTVTLIGATTENPSFQVNAALLSRARVIVLRSLKPKAIEHLLRRAWDTDLRQKRWPNAQIDDDVWSALSGAVEGDARRALNTLEAGLNDGQPITLQRLSHILARPALCHNRDGDHHYQVVSAFIKSMRATDPDAAAYWLMRLIDAGEDPMFIARRLVIFASEDIGHADPGALTLAVAAMNAAHLVGLPEGVYPLMQATTYLATAPKSNTVLRTIHRVRESIKQHGALPVPVHFRNEATALNRSIGNGDGYANPHIFHGDSMGQSGLPETLKETRFFEPTECGMEGQFKERLGRQRSRSNSD